MRPDVTIRESQSHFLLPTELLALQNVIQDKDVKALLERSISTLSSTVGEKS